MSCSIFFNLNVLMLHKFALKFAAFQISWPSNELIGILRHVNVFLEDVNHQQLLPLEALACLQGIQDTAPLRLRAYTLTWSTQ